MSQWFTSWFNNPMYLTLYQHRDKKEAELTVSTILYELDKLQPSFRLDNTKILDVACGSGRHAIAFASKGFKVLANDLSQNLLKIAKKKTFLLGLENKIDFSNQDMRNLSYEFQFDLVVQLFTSFGYFDNLNDDRKTIRNIFNCLKNEGFYVLDFFNINAFQKNLPRTKKYFIDNKLIFEETKMESDFIVKRIKIEKEKPFVEKVRAYTFDRLKRLLNEERFEVKKTLGHYNGDAFSPNSPRIIFFCTKKK